MHLRSRATASASVMAALASYAARISGCGGSMSILNHVHIPKQCGHHSRKQCGCPGRPRQSCRHTPGMSGLGAPRPQSQCSTAAQTCFACRVINTMVRAQSNLLYSTRVMNECTPFGEIVCPSSKSAFSVLNLQHPKNNQLPLHNGVQQVREGMEISDISASPNDAILSNFL